MNEKVRILLLFILGVLCALASIITYDAVLKLKEEQQEEVDTSEEYTITEKIEVTKLDTIAKLTADSDIKRYCVKLVNEPPLKDDECFKDFEGNEALFEILEDSYYLWAEDNKGNLHEMP